MKFKLNKKTLKNLSKDSNALPVDMTPQVAGGAFTARCNTDGTKCEETVRCTWDCVNVTAYCEPAPSELCEPF